MNSATQKFNKTHKQIMTTSMLLLNDTILPTMVAEGPIRPPPHNFWSCHITVSTSAKKNYNFFCTICRLINFTHICKMLHIFIRGTLGKLFYIHSKTASAFSYHVRHKKELTCYGSFERLSSSYVSNTVTDFTQLFFFFFSPS